MTFTHDDELRRRITANVAAHHRTAVELDARRRAAVAIVVVDSVPGSDPDDPADVGAGPLANVPGLHGTDHDLDDKMTGVSGGAAFLLCRRAARMNSHARQWALPGGRIDSGETAEHAALRELREELGVDLGADCVVGLLDDYPSRSGFVITPVVIWAPGTVELQPNPAEVTNVYRVGLHELCRLDSPRFVHIPESDRPVVQLALGGSLIHAPTGAVMLQFRRVGIEGYIDERVDHLEQPVFAWR